jgi:hypothetical protein
VKLLKLKYGYITTSTGKLCMEVCHPQLEEMDRMPQLGPISMLEASVQPL